MTRSYIPPQTTAGILGKQQLNQDPLQRRIGYDPRGYSDPHHRLLSISRVLSTDPPVDIIFGLVYEALSSCFTFDDCILFSSLPIPKGLVGIHQLSGSPGFERFWFAALQEGTRLVREACKDGLPRLGKPDKRNGQMESSAQPKGQIIYPFSLADQVIGVFTLFRNNTHFTLREYELSQLFLAQLAISLEKTLSPKVALSDHPTRQATLSVSKDLEFPLEANDVTEKVGIGALALSGADRVAVIGQWQEAPTTHFWSQGFSLEGINQLLTDSQQIGEELQVCQNQACFAADISHLPETSKLRKLAVDAGAQSIAHYPIVYEDRKLASIDCFYSRRQEWKPGDYEAFNIFTKQAAIVFENIRLSEELENAYLQTVLTLAKALTVRDAYTADHSQRVKALAENTARRMNCSVEDLQRIRWAALLHDIGKIGVPDSILHKAGPLDTDEWAVMKRHPEIGVEIISPVRRLQEVAPIIRSHQEKFDGSGYPDGLSGEQIPLAARILTVVDAYGAMTDNRVFRKALSKQEAVAELSRCVGKQFDQQVVDVFFDVIGANQVVVH